MQSVKNILENSLAIPNKPHMNLIFYPEIPPIGVCPKDTPPTMNNFISRNYATLQHCSKLQNIAIYWKHNCKTLGKS